MKAVAVVLAIFFLSVACTATSHVAPAPVPTLAAPSLDPAMIFTQVPVFVEFRYDVNDPYSAMTAHIMLDNIFKERVVVRLKAQEVGSFRIDTFSVKPDTTGDVFVWEALQIEPGERITIVGEGRRTGLDTPRFAFDIETIRQ